MLTRETCTGVQESRYLKKKTLKIDFEVQQCCSWKIQKKGKGDEKNGKFEKKRVE